MKQTMIASYAALTGHIDRLGQWVGLLSLRLILGWEFFEAGLQKAAGENWFGDIADRFPFPFNLLPHELSWQIALWSELLGGIAIALGLGTRVFAVSLSVLTVVAIVSVHWPEHWATWSDLLKGYAISDEGHGNFKLPLLYLTMLVPLMLMGPGKFSLDHIVAWLSRKALSA